MSTMNLFIEIGDGTSLSRLMLDLHAMTFASCHKSVYDYIISNQSAISYNRIILNVLVSCHIKIDLFSYFKRVLISSCTSMMISI